MQIYALESCRTIINKLKKKVKFYFNWIYSELHIWSSDHKEMSLADTGCDNDAELREMIWPYT